MSHPRDTLLTLLALALGVGYAADTLAQTGKLAQARERFTSCQKLLDAGKGCEAKETCEEGLAIKEIGPLVDLTRDARAACKKEKKEKAQRDKRRRDEKRSRVEAKSSCPEGQEITPDTAGQCCWPGQVWNGEKCVGVPTRCPGNLGVNAEAESCTKKLCDDAGRVETADGKGCCWPGQGYSITQKACVGKPECPKGFQRNGSDCARLPDDEDSDGIVDAEDKCPGEPEDYDGFADDDGCVDPDNDNDGLCDNTLEDVHTRFIAGRCRSRDSCPDTPEDRDSFEDEDGCPESDNDNDAVVDAEDACPSKAEDFDGWEDEDGCPDTDNDNDGLFDAEDQCPDDAEDFDGTQDSDGCPENTAKEIAEQQAAVGDTGGDTGSDDGNGMLIAGGVTTALGLLVIGGGVGLHLSAESMRDQVRDAPRDMNFPDEEVIDGQELSQVEAKQLEDDANLYATLGVIGYGVGGALLVTGVTLLILDLTDDEARPPEEDAEASSGVELGGGVYLDRDQVLFGVSGRF